MKVSPLSLFRVEDYPSQKEWIGQFFLPLNNTLGQLTQALNGQVTAGDNIPAFTKSITGSTLSLPQTFKFTGTFTPVQMQVMQAFKNGIPIAMVGAWAKNGDTITVSKLYELTDAGNIPLTSGDTYSINLRFT